MVAPGYVVLANADAGSHDEERLGAALQPLHEAGHEVAVHRTEDRSEVDAVVRALDGRTLVVAGGDGSLHVAVQALHDAGALGDTPVGLLPLGTGNDFARAASIPLDPGDAGRLLVGARARPTDLVVDDAGVVVVNASHAGMSAAAADRATDLKGRLGPAAYPAAAFLEGIGTVGFRATVRADGQELVGDDDLLMVGVGNGSSIGGGTPLFPEASLDDGRLEVLVARATGPLARVGFAARLRAGTHTERPDVVAAPATEVVVEGEPVPHCRDGEVSDPAARRTYRLHAGAWSVVRPAS